MNATATTNWHEANQRFLTAALAGVREALERHARRMSDRPKARKQRRDSQQTLPPTDGAMPAPSALETLCELFGLSSFERDVLLLCAGMELDADFPSLCAAAQGDPQRTYPTFSLALAVLPEAHWSALSPEAPLRYRCLIEMEGRKGLTLSPLRIDERVLHYLTGVQHLDERLMGFIEPVSGADDLAPSHRALAEQLAATWSRAVGKTLLPIVQLCGGQTASQRAIAAAACARLNLNLHTISAQTLPLEPRDLTSLMRLWEREAALSVSALLLDCGDLDTSDAARENAIVRLIESTNGVLLVSSRARRRIRGRPLITMDVDKPTGSEQRQLWQHALGATASGVNGEVEAMVSQFNLGASTIHAVCVGALGSQVSDETKASNELGRALWDACRIQARSRLDDLAQRIEPAASWDDLVLPEAQHAMLRQMAVHVRQRTTVYERWGFITKGARGLGISALFAGPSGTGKTMAAEVLANELRLDLYRIDLSSVVSKYIGETEKNLRRVFDAAEESGAILLFDEADALFGKRSEVKDSHDRYANIEVGYLLQRMEAYRGLAILTTNMKSALDDAFLRRIRFIVQFPFPDAAQRAEIWRRIFPSATPTKDLAVNKLARLNVAGGNIRNIALNAAFLAADAGEPVQMTHLLRAARSEYAKLEKTLTAAETGGWV